MHPVEYDYSRRIQTHILALLIQSNEFVLNHPSCIKPEYFSDPINTIIARAYLSKQDGTYKFDVATLTQLVKSDLDSSETSMWRPIRRRIRHLFGMSVNEKYLEEEVVKFARHQAVTNALLESIDDIREHNYEKVIPKLMESVNVGTVDNDIGLNVLESSPTAVLRKIHIKKVKTGFPTLDNILDGGLGGGELGIVMGSSGRGKSIWTQDVAASVTTMVPGSTVVVISLEMSEEKYTARLYRRLTGMTRDEVARNKKRVRVKLKNLMNASKSTLIVKRYPQKTVTTEGIHAYIRNIKSKGIVPTVLFVDYADLIRPVHRRNDKRDEIGDIYVELRGIAQEENIPIWTPTQTNRKGYNKTVVDIDDISEDFSKVMTADVVLTLCQTLDERKDDKMRWFMAKVRDGADKIFISSMIDYDRMKFHDLGLEAI